MKKIIERVGVPDNIIETSNILFKKIIERLDNDKNHPIHMYEEFIVIGDFIVGDFKIDKMRIRISVDNTNPTKNLELISAGYSGNPILIDKFKLKQVDYSIENNYINFNISSSVEHNITFVNISKFFKQNEEQIITILSHEIKHVYDNFKKPVSGVLKNSEYKSYDANINIQPLNNLIYSMYFTSDFEKTVVNTEFYSILNKRNIKKSEFAEFLNNSQTYKRLKAMRNFTLDGLVEEIKNSYMEQVDEFLKALGYLIEKYSTEQKITLVLKATQITLNNLNLNYLSKFLINVSDPILRYTDENRDFYNKTSEKLQSVDTIKFFNDKIKTINKNADEIIRKIGKLYILLNEDITFEDLRMDRPERWGNY